MLKKDLKPWQRQAGCIPSVSSDSIWHLEDVLGLYAESEDPRYPPGCFDESLVQLTREIRQTLPAQPGQPACYDTEYKREGTAHLFLFVQPLQGWRHVNVTQQRTPNPILPSKGACWWMSISRRPNVSGGSAIASTPIIWVRFAKPSIRRPPGVSGNAWRFTYTPKHGSWPNIAELELSVLTRQCLDHRLPNLDPLRQEAQA